MPHSLLYGPALAAMLAAALPGLARRSPAPSMTRTADNPSTDTVGSDMTAVQASRLGNDRRFVTARYLLFGDAVS